MPIYLVFIQVLLSVEFCFTLKTYLKGAHFYNALQTALHVKAKESPSFRFYALYDKVHRKDVLAFAYECCKANGGAAGVDGQKFEDIESQGVERWLDELAQELKSRTYQPLPVRRVYIPKPDGNQRPLGIPAIRDRTAERGAVLGLEPIV